MKNAGAILEPACLYADQGERELVVLANVVRQYNCRNAVIHFGDINFLERILDISRITVVVDFPYGKNINYFLARTILKATDSGITNFDICINLTHALSNNLKAIQTSFEIVQTTLNSSWASKREIKAIIQLPYLWQYAKDCIDPLICMLAESGVSVIKDWTTVSNFSKPIDVSLASRLDYLDYVKRVISIKQLPLKVKIAGGVRPDNAVKFVKHGADILGVSVQYVPDVILSLESE